MNSYNEIYRITADDAKEQKSRNFNFLVSNNDYDEISVTYDLNNKKYWGLNPRFSELDIREWILSSKSPLATVDGLNHAYEEFVENDLWYFGSESEIRSRAFFKRVMLTFSNHFFFYYKVDEAADYILNDLWAECELSRDKFDYVDINLRLMNLNEKNNDVRKINGRIPDCFIEKLNAQELKYSLLPDTNKSKNIIYIGKNGDYSILDLYSDTRLLDDYLYCVSGTFYSGSMARMDSVEPSLLNGNSRVYNYTFQLSTISYATHIGFKDPRMNFVHYYFCDEERNSLIEMDKVEANLQLHLIEHLQESLSDISAMKYFNEYLKTSIYTHGLNASGNIITIDNEVLYTKRGAETWDKSVLYCSSNGVCEVYNEDIIFYRKSVNCDWPKIGEYGRKYGNFGGELSREAYAELGVEINPTTWKYYGFCIMGYKNIENENHSFPLHVNILAQTNINDKIENVIYSSKTAVEKNENDYVKCLKCLRKSEQLKNFIINIGKTVYEMSGMLADALILISVFNTVLFMSNNDTVTIQSVKNVIASLDIVDKISLIIALIVLISLVAKIIQSVKSYKKYNEWHYVFYCTDEPDYSNFYQLMKQNYKNRHTIFTLMMLLYYKDNSEYKNGDEN